MIKTILAISCGASFGALFRWYLGLKLNSIYPDLPMGTLSANLLGGYLIGFFIAFFATNTALSPEWKLFIITGFLGGLTTFSTFSAEIITLMQSAKYMTAAFGAALHLGGSLFMTFAGIGTYWFVARIFS